MLEGLFFFPETGLILTKKKKKKANFVALRLFVSLEWAASVFLIMSSNLSHFGLHLYWGLGWILFEVNGNTQQYKMIALLQINP